MSRTIVTVEQSPDYPIADISPESADILSLLLQNHGIVTDAHNSTETSIPFYGRTHRAIGILAKRLSKEDIAYGMHIGATTFEAISCMVRPVPPLIDKPESLSIYRPYFVTGGILPAIEMFEKAQERLENDCPNIAQVVREVASRHNRSLSSAALMAAGISREIEMDILDAA